MRVLKFGGSSLADYACLQQVAQLVKAQLKDEMLLVLSAPGGMTDSLSCTCKCCRARAQIFRSNGKHWLAAVKV